MNPKLLTQFLKAELHRRDFYSFCKMYDPNFFSQDKPHLKLIASQMQRIADGEIKKLMISIPPRAGKSYITSLFCAWMLGNHPTESIMRNSYSMEIAGKFSYDVRSIITSHKYKTVFPKVFLRNDRTGIIDWALVQAKQSSYFCSGVGGSITGKGCSLLAVLDDPIKNIEDALSETIIEKTWAWYTSTHLARMESGCAEIQIATRWSKNDVIGKLCEMQSSDLSASPLSNRQAGWVQILIPALDENGKSFCEAIKTTEEYHELKRINDVYIWDAEYMQQPIEKGGLLFPLNELKKYSSAEDRFDTVIGYCDTADTGKDYLCALIGGLRNKKILVADVLLTQENMEVTERKLAELIIRNNCKVMTIESNSAGKIFSRNVQNILKENNYACQIKTVFNSKNKETRILVNSGLVKQNCLFKDTYETASEYDLFIRHITSYIKAGKNKSDDAVDALTGLYEVSTQFTPAEKIYSKRVNTLSKTLRGFHI